MHNGITIQIGFDTCTVQIAFCNLYLVLVSMFNICINIFRQHVASIYGFVRAFRSFCCVIKKSQK